MRRPVRFLFIAIAALGAGAWIGLGAGSKVDGIGADPRTPAVHVSPLPAVAAQAAAPRAVVPPKPAPAWLRNAVAITIPMDRKLIAIVIDDMGVDRARSDRAASLPAPLTLAFLPYARNFEAQIAASRARGHEILVHVPMEPIGTENPGPGALTLALDDAEIRRRLGLALDRAGPVVGINNHMGSRFTVERDVMRPVLEELKARGLLFLDSRTAGATVGPALAQSMDVPHAVRDIFLDNDPSPVAVRAQLRELEAAARRRGHAVAIGHPHDGTIEALAAWLPDVSARGFTVVPISAIVRLSREHDQGG
jgi:polysaccharide deacetylase 2 family uncharacterized protein YibQ